MARSGGRARAGLVSVITIECSAESVLLVRHGRRREKRGRVTQPNAFLAASEGGAVLATGYA